MMLSFATRPSTLWPDGTRDVLGIWIEQTDGAKFWRKVFNELRRRGVNCQRRLKFDPPSLRGAKKYDILGTLDEGERGELLDLLLWRASAEAEVVALNCLQCWQGGELQQRLSMRSIRAACSVFSNVLRKSAKPA